MSQHIHEQGSYLRPEYNDGADGKYAKGHRQGRVLEKRNPQSRVRDADKIHTEEARNEAEGEEHHRHERED